MASAGKAYLTALKIRSFCERNQLPESEVASIILVMLVGIQLLDLHPLKLMGVKS
jgi:hypothetical protein